MATIAQPGLFSWKNIEAASDLDRLRMVLAAVPDEELMRKMEEARGKGRNKYPVRAVWNSMLAAVVFGHESIESLRRELKRNGQLLDLCGFDSTLGMDAVPTAAAYTRFLKNLYKLDVEIEKIFDNIVDSIKQILPDFGRYLAIDSKAVSSAGKKTDKPKDGRRDTDADFGVKTYIFKEGEKESKKTKSWFGYKIHLIVDSNYDLPLAYMVTKASCSDMTQLIPMMNYLNEKHQDIVKTAEYLQGDKGYDSTDNNRYLWDKFRIKPIIDKREMWKDGETTRPLAAHKADNIVYSGDGRVYCHGPGARAGEQELREMAFCGFEAPRGTLKYRCPAAAYGTDCPARADGSCGGAGHGRQVRVPLSLDRRIFTPVPRHSYKWKREYKKRSAVERVNSRLGLSFGFERHFIRNMDKMRARTGIALIVMLSMALGSLRSGRKDRMRSLVWSPGLKKAA